MKNKINHKEIVKIVSTKTGDNEKDVQKHIECYINTLMEQMCLGSNVGIKYLGTMRVEKVAEKPAWDFKAQRNVIRPNRMLPKMSFNRDFINKVKSSVNKI